VSGGEAIVALKYLVGKLILEEQQAFDFGCAVRAWFELKKTGLDVGDIALLQWLE
jgi:hypothetical protein